MEGRNADRWREEGRQEERARRHEEIKALALTLPEMKAQGVAEERARLRPLLERCLVFMEDRTDGENPLCADLRRELGKEG